MTSLRKIFDDIDSENFIKKSELVTLQEIDKIRSKTGINFTKFCFLVKNVNGKKRSKSELVMLYEMWCGEMAAVKTEYYQEPEEWVVGSDKGWSFRQIKEE